MKYVTDDGTVFETIEDATKYEQVKPTVEKYVADLDLEGGPATRLIKAIMRWEMHRAQAASSGGKN